MRSNTLISILLFVVMSSILRAQQNKFPHIIAADSTWSKEIIPFPIHFAPQIPLKGYEDAQFMPGWAKKDSSEFWTYTFAWILYDSPAISEKEIETYLQYYFDGLMKVVNKNPSKASLPISKAYFSELIHTKNGVKEYIGYVEIFDAFHTQDMMKLDCKITQQYCTIQNQSILVFKFSPKHFSHNIWKTLDNIEIVKNACF